MAGRSCSDNSRAGRQGFTLVEMLVVVGVIALLVGLVVPVMASFRAESQSTICLSNQRQIFIAVETSRQQHKDMLPYAAPLPVAPGQFAILPGLPKKLEKIMPERCETWFCPADHSEESQEIGSGYMYLPGAFMLLEPPLIPEPPNPPLTFQANADRVVRLITQRYTAGYLRTVPILADSDKHHEHGNRQPWNVTFVDGTTRVSRPGDGEIASSPSAPSLPNP